MPSILILKLGSTCQLCTRLSLFVQCENKNSRVAFFCHFIASLFYVR